MGRGAVCLPAVVDLIAFGLFEPVIAEGAVKLDIFVSQVSVMDLKLPFAFRALNGEYPRHAHPPVAAKAEPAGTLFVSLLRSERPAEPQ